METSERKQYHIRQYIMMGLTTKEAEASYAEQLQRDQARAAENSRNNADKLVYSRKLETLVTIPED